MASEKPFKPLEEFTEASPGGFALIKQARENPNVLVKKILIVDEGNKDKLDPNFIENYDFNTFKSEVVEPINFLRSRGFDRFIPKTEFIWGEDEDGEEKGFLLMKKIKGKEIEDLKEISPRIARELDIFLSEYFAVQSENMMSGGDIIVPDIPRFTKEKGIMLVNLMVGKAHGDKEDHVYLVDLYPAKRSRVYYQRIDLDEEGRDWFILIDSLRQKAGGKYDFLPAQAALRNYLFTLETWQKRGGRKIDTPQKAKEKPAFELEVKISAGSSAKEIEGILSRKSFAIPFLLTKDLTLYLSHLGHSDIKNKDGLDWNNVLVDGYLELENDDLSVFFYGNPDSETKEIVRRALAKFLKLEI